jgi:hypothetical protein
MEPVPSSTCPEPVPSLSPPWSRAVIKFSPEPPRHRSRPQSSPFTCRHLPRLKPVMSSTTQAPSPSPRRRSWACNNIVLPEPRRCALDIVPKPVMPLTHSTVVLPEAAMSLSPWCPRARDAVEPAPSLSLQHRRPPQSRKATLYIFLCHFWPTNPDFDMLHCHIDLICYIAFVLLHCFNVLHCHIALICYIAFNMSQCFDMLHCHISLICYIPFDMLHYFDMLHCHIALIIYIAFVLLHCFDMLHCHIILICYTLLYCFCSATFWYIWMHTILLNDESGLSETSVATWTNIIVLLRFQLWTTCSK